MKLPGSTFLAMAASALAFSTFIGCGGSGGGTAAPSGKSAGRASVIGGNQGSANGGKYLLPLLTASSPSTSPFYLVSQMMKTRGNTFDSALNLYYNNSVTGNTWTQNYFTDAAGTVSAGSISATEPGRTTFTNSFTSYPAVVNLTTNVTAGNLPSKGTGTVTFLDSSGRNTLKSQIILPKTNVSVATDMTLDGSGAVGGSITLQADGLTVNVTNLSGTVSAGFTGDVTITPGGYTGTATINLTTGDFSAVVNVGGGITATATVSGYQQLSINYSDNTSLTLSNALTSNPSGSGTTGSTTGSTSTTSTGTTATSATATGTTSTTSTGTSSTGTTSGTIGNHGSPNPTYNAPVQISGPVDSNGHPTYSIVGALPSGQIIGNVATGGGLYWSSPTATPIPLATLSGDSYSVAGGIAMVSGKVEVVGTSVHATSTPVIWRDPTAVPVALPQPGGNTSCQAYAINSSEQIVGEVGNVPCYWSTPSASPQTLPQDGNGNPKLVNAIADNGVAAYLNIQSYTGADFSTEAAFYPKGLSPNSQLVVNSGFGAFQLNSSGTMAVGSILKSGGVYNAGTWSSADGFANFTPIQKGGYTSRTYGAAVDAAGDILIKVDYTDFSSGLLYQAAGSSTTVDITNQTPANDGWQIDAKSFGDSDVLEFHFIFSDGSVLAYGQKAGPLSYVPFPVYIKKK